MVQAMGIPIFNRISEISYVFRDLSEIQLETEDVARMHDLEHISVSKRNETIVNESDVKTVRDIVPPCRLASLGKIVNQIKIKVNHRAMLASASR